VILLSRIARTDSTNAPFHLTAMIRAGSRFAPGAPASIKRSLQCEEGNLYSAARLEMRFPFIQAARPISFQ